MLVPSDFERRRSFPSRADMIGGEGHGIVEAHHLTHALHRFRLAVVERESPHV
jgi:hypothetical protein